MRKKHYKTKWNVHTHTNNNIDQIFNVNSKNYLLSAAFMSEH